MSCCPPGGYDDFFTDRMAARDARRYRRRGLDAVGRRVVDALAANGLAGATVLEIGGGVGALQLELLKAGAASVVNVELAPAYEEHARSLAREAGVHDRIERRLFDFAVEPERVETADVVVLHKVVCCYPDYRALVGAAAERARRTLALTLPRGAWWNRLGFAGINACQHVRRQDFRVFVHEPGAVLAAAAEHGLARDRAESGTFWLFAALVRRAVVS